MPIQQSVKRWSSVCPHSVVVYSHAVSRGEVSVNKLVAGEVLHSPCHIQTHCCECLHSGTLGRNMLCVGVE